MNIPRYDFYQFNDDPPTEGGPFVKYSDIEHLIPLEKPEDKCGTSSFKDWETIVNKKGFEITYEDFQKLKKEQLKEYFKKPI